MEAAMFDKTLKRLELQAERMGRMMERLGVAPVELARSAGGRGYAEAARRCMHCTNGEACQDWLDRGATTSPDFCPNSQRFHDLGQTTPASGSS
jgi:hypothetical protein